jgi:hypothetical protein
MAVETAEKPTTGEALLELGDCFAIGVRLVWVANPAEPAV